MVNGVFDVIIIGAGPGGSVAANVALKGGMSVLQIEKGRLPRAKPCAGGLTVKSRNLIPREARPRIVRTAAAFSFSTSNGPQLHFKHLDPVLRFVKRPEFDAALVEGNRAFPAFRFLQGTTAASVGFSGLFEIEAGQEVFRGRQLIGSDGAYSVVNRTFGISRPKGRATGIEISLPKSQATVSRLLAPCFDFGTVDQGYGWVFPKDDHWSIGLYTLAGQVRGLKERLRDYVAEKGFQCHRDPLETVEAFRYGVGGYRLTPPDCPVYLVGDAGGFAEAITGEGIYYAMESGRLAAETALGVQAGTRQHRSYYRALWSSVLLDTFLSWQAAKVFYSNPGRWLKLLRLPPLWRPLVQGYSEGATLSRSLILGGYYTARSLTRALPLR